MNIQNYKTLRPEQIDFYKKNGYLLTEQPLFDENKFQNLYSIFEELLEKKGNSKGNELDVPHFEDNRLFDFLLADEVLDLVEDLIGPNIGLWSSHFIVKEPKTGKRTPWHEDSAYWEGRFDRYDNIITLWLAMEPSRKENGCMGVIPGTHGNGFSAYKKINTDHEIFTDEIDSKDINEDEAVWFELNPNYYSLHDSKIIHGANANESNIRRTGYTMRYFSTDLSMTKDHPGNLNHKVYHCRGLNRGNNPLISI